MLYIMLPNLDPVVILLSVLLILLIECEHISCFWSTDFTKWSTKTELPTTNNNNTNMYDHSDHDGDKS